jgi:hypothetical protein
LLDLGLRADPAITADEITEAIRRLDRLDDSVFVELYGRTLADVARIRARFADWPRT